METGHNHRHICSLTLTHANGSENIPGSLFYMLWLAPRTDEDLRVEPWPSKTDGKEVIPSLVSLHVCAEPHIYPTDSENDTQSK